ncbi:MAG: LptF/LptG family permease [Phycisphaerales bacterium]|nr:LptF/LptG family permease [Phycisphaerales bacterium]
MPWILHRHILAELLKVLVLTTIVIVVVIAFGAVIKPLSQNLLGPGGTLKYILLAMVPMLQYALPFAAGFAATLVTHRFASDNEIQAMVSSGLSYRTILLPHAVLGVALTVIMFVLVQTAIPRLLERMYVVITEDAAQVFVSTVRSGEAFRAGNFFISADRIGLDEAPGSGIHQRIRMEGVVAIEVNSAGQLETEFVAKAGSADLYMTESELLVKVAFKDATVLRPGDSAVAFLPLAEPMPTVIDRSWARSPNYFGAEELLRAVRDPGASAAVELTRTRMEAALSGAFAIDRLARQLEATGHATLVSTEASRTYVVRDAMVGGRGLIPLPPAKRLTVVESDASGVVREAVAKGASLVETQVTQGSTASDRLDLVLDAAEAHDPRASDERIVPWPPRVVALTVPALDPSAEPSLLERARAIASATVPPLSSHAKRAQGFVDEIAVVTRNVRDEALSHVFMRFAQPTGVFLLLLLGGVLAIWRRSSLPLTIYILAFLPGIVDVLLITSGQSIIKSHRLASGVAVMWAGNALLLAWVWFSWRRMARH